MSDDVVRADELIELPAVSAPETAAAPARTAIVFPALWYTSGSPMRTGQMDCDFRRYVGYHAGEHGTGYRRRATAVPLATGKSVHRGLQLLGEWILDWQTTHRGLRLTNGIDDPLVNEVVAWAASEAASGYERRARSKGLLLQQADTQTNVAVNTLILEQRTLVEALVWMYAIMRLPVMLASYRLLAVEVEETPVLDCSCGLGDWVGSIADHVARNCVGIVDQGRGDYLWEGATPATENQIAYEEFKTKASERGSWEAAWEHSGQLWLNMEAATRRMGRAVDTAFVPVLFKGWRGRERSAPVTEPKYQHSPLCYGYFDPGSPPMREPNWSAAYKWVDDLGKGHTLPRTYERQPIWDEQIAMPIVRAGASRVESWIKQFLTPMQMAGLVKVLGPFPRPQHRLGDATRAVLAEERRWRQDVAWLRDLKVFNPAHPEVGGLIARSWNCTGYDGTRCEFWPICNKEPGWEDIESMGLFEPRTPHHRPERDAFEALGVEFGDEDDEDEGEEGDG